MIQPDPARQRPGTQRWHAHHHSTGTGHVYRGRIESFPVQDDGDFLTGCRHEERSALRAVQVPRAERRWGSLRRHASKNPRVGPALSPFPR